MADWIFLTRLYKEAPVDSYWLTKQFSKNVDYSPIPKVKIVSETSSLTVASLGKVYDPPKPVKIGVNVSEMLVDPAQIFEYDNITEEDIFARNYNPAVLAIKGKQDVVSSKDYLYAKKTKELKGRVLRRIELMFAQTISEGKITYNDGERAFEADFGVTAADYTLSSSTKVVSDLRDLVKEMKSMGFSPAFVLITPNVERALWDNTQFTKAIDKNSFNVAQMRYDTLKEPFVDFIATAKGLPPIYSYSAEYTEGGSSKSYIEGDKIILVDPKGIGLAYGAIVNTNLDKNMNPIQIDVAVWEEEVNHGTQLAMFVLSRPLTYIINANAVKILNVTIS